jgi:hypothetical protein
LVKHLPPELLNSLNQLIGQARKSGFDRAALIQALKAPWGGPARTRGRPLKDDRADLINRVLDRVIDNDETLNSAIRTIACEISAQSEDSESAAKRIRRAIKEHSNIDLKYDEPEEIIFHLTICRWYPAGSKLSEEWREKVSEAYRRYQAWKYPDGEENGFNAYETSRLIAKMEREVEAEAIGLPIVRKRRYFTPDCPPGEGFEHWGWNSCRRADKNNPEI